MASSSTSLRLKEALNLQERQNRISYRLTCGGLMMAKERNLCCPYVLHRGSGHSQTNRGFLSAD